VQHRTALKEQEKCVHESKKQKNLLQKSPRGTFLLFLFFFVGNSQFTMCWLVILSSNEKL
jgi:hypothetical protein